MAALGTLAWARKSGGRLSFFDQLELARQAVVLRAVRRRMARTDYPALAPRADDLAVPDSAVAMRAVFLAREISQPFLLNHCFRTFFWAKLLARRGGTSYDAELLFVAAMLHDLGLTATHQAGQPQEHCFAVTGARRAAEALQGTAWSTQRVEAVEEAITLHMNIMVPTKFGAEAHLLHAGAALDVVGARHREVQGPAERAVLNAHPRLDHKLGFNTALAHQCSFRPSSRLAFLVGRGFHQMVDDAPFSS